MAGPLTQSESQVIYRRLSAIAVALLGLKEEADRLFALNQSVDLNSNLDPEAGGHLTKAEAVTLVGEVNNFRDFWENETVAATTAPGDPARRAAFDPFILAEPLL
jgi:hypothetical protein